ncbi:altronate dehydratase [Candidatus Poribacteria bacterium]|nr:altronate dehydratase [Candidatus Poribacteria bacterium]
MSVIPLSEKAVLLRAGDDVAVAREGISPTTLALDDGSELSVADAIRPGHKFALRDIPADAPVRKYGQTIGFATEGIAAGSHVHVHNVSARDFERDYRFAAEATPLTPYPESQMRVFDGYARPNGGVGTRNYIAVISTVNCSASVSSYVSREFDEERLRAYANVDGVLAITHKGGCGTNLGGADYVQLQRTLAGFARHPNIFGYVLMGLGCEVNQIVDLVHNQGLLQIETIRKPPKTISIQEEGGIRKAITAGIRAVEEMLPAANECRRTPQPISKITIGAECGGSDANSGITANPAVGVCGDELVKYGGTHCIAETTEMYGAEHLLTARAVSEEVGKKLVGRIRWWENYATMLGAEIDNNPTPGNKEGGLTTIYEKSLGAIAKGGTSPLTAVYEFAEPMTEPGFVVMDTPGYDPVSVTGMVAGGANVVLFTTGRGSVFGFKPVPSIKIATNSRLYHHMIDDMDINAGDAVEGGSVHDVGMTIFEDVIAVASGKPTKSELAGVGELEFCPWVLGPIL